MTEIDGIPLKFSGDGLWLGEAPLVGKDALGVFRPCPPPMLQRYLEGREGNLQAVANFLNKGNESLAVTAAIHLRLPDIPPRLFRRLQKYDPDQPRVSAGNPDGG